MHPILFEIFGFQVPSYGIVLVGAFLTATFLLKREAPRLDLDGNKIMDAAIAGLLGGLIGAKLLLILIDLPTYLSNPRELLGVLRSAGVIDGGQIGGAIAVIWYVRRHKLPFWNTLDLMAPFMALGMGLGRLACLAAGCCYGLSHWDGPLPLDFGASHCIPGRDCVGHFPVQLVDLGAGILLFAILLAVLRRRSFKGQVVALLAGLYGLSRGLIEFLRGDLERGLWWGGNASTSQIIALCGIVLAVVVYFVQRKKGEHA